MRWSSIQFYGRVICFAFGIRKYYGLQIKDYSRAIYIHADTAYIFIAAKHRARTL